MEEQNRRPSVKKDPDIYDPEIYNEETAAEFAEPVNLGRNRSYEINEETTGAGKGFGYAALILAILSLFTAPVLFGATGIILGFVARNRGARTLGNWAIGLGALSVIVSLFLAPFF